MSTRRGLPTQGSLGSCQGSAGLSGGCVPCAGWADSAVAGAGPPAAAVGSSLTCSRYPLLGSSGAVEAAQRSVTPTDGGDLDFDLERENPAAVRRSEDQDRSYERSGG